MSNLPARLEGYRPDTQNSTDTQGRLCIKRVATLMNMRQSETCRHAIAVYGRGVWRIILGGLNLPLQVCDRGPDTAACLYAQHS